MPSAHSALDIPSSSPSPPPPREAERAEETLGTFSSPSSKGAVLHGHPRSPPHDCRRVCEEDEEEDEEEADTATRRRGKGGGGGGGEHPPWFQLKRGLSSPNPGMKKKRRGVPHELNLSDQAIHEDVFPQNHLHSPGLRQNAHASPPLSPLSEHQHLRRLQLDAGGREEDRSASSSSSFQKASSSRAELEPFPSLLPDAGVGERSVEERVPYYKPQLETKRKTAGTSLLQVSLPPFSPCLILTDWYQLAMLYANWREGRHLQNSVFEAFFRKAPFQGEYAVMAGVKQVLDFVSHMRFTEDEIDFFR